MTDDKRMTLMGHLVEFRRRLIRCTIAFVIGMLLCFYLAYEPMKYVLVAPLEALNPQTTNFLAAHNPLIRVLKPYVEGQPAVEPVQLHAMTMMEVFIVKLHMAMLGGLIVAAPYLFYQVWSFVGSGLLTKERSLILRYLPASLGLFVAGMAFAYFAAIPVAVIYLLTLDPDIRLVLMYRSYIKLIVMVLASFGLVFQIPLVMMATAKLGLVKAKTFSHYRRHAIVGIFIAAALLAPSPEPFSQCLLAIPMVGLYEMGVLLAKMKESK